MEKLKKIISSNKADLSAFKILNSSIIFLKSSNKNLLTFFLISFELSSVFEKEKIKGIKKLSFNFLEDKSKDKSIFSNCNSNWT